MQDRRSYYEDPEIEGYLQTFLSPIQPNPDFVSQLQERLFATPAVILETKTGQRAYLVLAIGLFSGVLLFWIFRRFIRRNTTPR